MGEYLVAITAVSVFLGLLGYLSYPSGSQRSVKLALALLLLYAVMLPLVSLVRGIAENGVPDSTEFPDASISGEYEEEYVEVAKSAFKSGICKLLFTKYGIEEEDAAVYVYNFDFESMKAERIEIVLSGSAKFKDYRAIESYVTGSGLGECEVEIEIG